MALLEGKTPTERNKIIAAGVLGVIALVALYMAFGRAVIGGGSTSVTVKISPSPTPGASTNRNAPSMPSASEQDLVYQTQEVIYRPGNAYAPDPGRNIFAFYEPTPPCRGDKCPSPTPPPPSPVKSPSPTPTAPMQLDMVNPMQVYAGAKEFRLDASGDRFTPDAHIYFNQSEVPTTFVSPQKLSANIPTKLIASEGPRQIIIQTPDGKFYSNQMIISVMAPPKPTYTYIGMIGRKRYNNDTAYFTEGDKGSPFGARLNDVLGGRFRLVDISASEVVFEDTSLGFKHRIPLSKNAAFGTTGPGRGGDDAGQPTYPPGFIPGQMPQPPQNIPGIPNSISPNAAPNPEQRKMEMQKMDKKDVDDDGDN